MEPRTKTSRVCPVGEKYFLCLLGPSSKVEERSGTKSFLIPSETQPGPGHAVCVLSVTLKSWSSEGRGRRDLLSTSPPSFDVTPAGKPGIGPLKNSCLLVIWSLSTLCLLKREGDPSD